MVSMGQLPSLPASCGASERPSGMRGRLPRKLGTGPWRPGYSWPSWHPGTWGRLFMALGTSSPVLFLHPPRRPPLGTPRRSVGAFGFVVHTCLVEAAARQVWLGPCTAAWRSCGACCFLACTRCGVPAVARVALSFRILALLPPSLVVWWFRRGLCLEGVRLVGRVPRSGLSPGPRGSTLPPTPWFPCSGPLFLNGFQLPVPDIRRLWPAWGSQATSGS